MRLRPLLPVRPVAAVAGARRRTRPEGHPAAPPPPPMRDRDAPAVEPDGSIEPEVTITTRGTEIHEEYRVNGQLYKVKVVPARGKPYYLVYDEFGKSRRSDLEPTTIIPQWVIKRF